MRVFAAVAAKVKLPPGPAAEHAMASAILGLINHNFGATMPLLPPLEAVLAMVNIQVEYKDKDGNKRAAASAPLNTIERVLITHNGREPRIGGTLMVTLSNMQEDISESDLRHLPGLLPFLLQRLGRWEPIPVGTPVLNMGSPRTISSANPRKLVHLDEDEAPSPARSLTFPSPGKRDLASILKGQSPADLSSMGGSADT